MKKYEALLSELDRCEYVLDDQYTGALANYAYNGITYEQSSYAYGPRRSGMPPQAESQPKLGFRALA